MNLNDAEMEELDRKLKGLKDKAKANLIGLGDKFDLWLMTHPKQGFILGLGLGGLSVFGLWHQVSRLLS